MRIIRQNMKRSALQPRSLGYNRQLPTSISHARVNNPRYLMYFSREAARSGSS